VSEQKRGSIEWAGRAVAECPKCGRELDTDDAPPAQPIPRGLKWRHLRCHGCGESFTVELTDAAPHHNED
jgi:transposase-like protein